jgi:hypothetical protein
VAALLQTSKAYEAAYKSGREVLSAATALA